MSHRVDYPEWEHNQWGSVRGSDTILRQSEPQGCGSANKNRIRNLREGLKMFSYKKLRWTYVDANGKTEHNGLYIGLLS
jgi:hypothetical protein